MSDGPTPARGINGMMDSIQRPERMMPWAQRQENASIDDTEVTMKLYNKWGINCLLLDASLLFRHHTLYIKL